MTSSACVVSGATSPEKFWDFFFLVYDEQPAFKMAWALNMSVRERAAYQAEQPATPAATCRCTNTPARSARDASGPPCCKRTGARMT